MNDTWEKYYMVRHKRTGQFIQYGYEGGYYSSTRGTCFRMKESAQSCIEELKHELEMQQKMLSPASISVRHKISKQIESLKDNIANSEIIELTIFSTSSSSHPEESK